MKKILSVLLLTAMLVSCVMPSLVSAAEKTLSLSVVGPEKVSVAGEPVELKIELSDNDEAGIWGATIAVAYTKGWTVNAVANGGLWEDSEFEYSLTPAPSAYKNVNIDTAKYDVALIHVEKNDVVGKVTDNGTLATVTLNAPEGLADGDTLEVKLAYDEKDPMTVGEDGQIIDIGFKVADYTATVEGAPVPVDYNVTAAVSAEEAKPGDTVTVDIMLPEDFPEVKSAAVSAFDYDRTALEYVSAKWNVEALLNDTASMDTKGTATMATSQNVKVNGSILTLTFNVIAEDDVDAKVSLKFTAKTKPAGGTETVIVNGKVVETAVKVVVPAPPVIEYDYNGDGEFELDDVEYLLDLCLFEDWDANDPDANPAFNQSPDVNGDGTFDTDDVGELLDIYMFQ